MISAPALLRDLKRLTATLEADLHGRIAAAPDLDASLSGEWQAAKDASRTAETLHDFKAGAVTQAASISLNRSLLETQFREPAQ